MLKIIGVGLLFLGGLGIGMEAANRLKQRVDSLQQLLRAVGVIAAQTHYGDALLTDVLDKAASDTVGVVSDFFTALNRRLRKDRFLTPSEAASQTLKELGMRLAFTENDCRTVVFMMEKLGCLQRVAQDDHLKLIEAEITFCLTQAQQMAQQKSRLYSYGSICGSLLLIILAI